MKILFLICLLLSTWTFFIEPQFVVKKKYKLNSADLKGINAVFISDLHIAPWQKGRLKRIVKIIQKQNPDIIFCTGDFVSGYLPHKTLPIEKIGKELSNLKPKYGFYAVLGNPDWWQNGAKIREVLASNGITILENSSKKIEINGKTITIAGIEDLQTRIPNPEKALKGATKTTVLLTHNPDTYFDLKEKVFLTLAGHNHGGQVQIPLYGALIVPSNSGTKYANGIFEDKNGTLIVTKGLGNSILNIRFCCPPEIVIIDFE